MLQHATPVQIFQSSSVVKNLNQFNPRSIGLTWCRTSRKGLTSALNPTMSFNKLIFVGSHSPRPSSHKRGLSSFLYCSHFFSCTLML